MIGIQKHELKEFEYNQFEKKTPSYLKWTFRKGTDKEFTVELERTLFLINSPISITFNRFGKKKTIRFTYGKDGIIEDEKEFSKKFSEEMIKFYVE